MIWYNGFSKILGVLLCGVILCVPVAHAAAGEERVALTGAVAYSDFLHFDYNKDGTMSKVQMWIFFDITAPVGNPGEPGYQPGSGTIRRCLRDADTGETVAGYTMYKLVPGKPMGQSIPVEDISLSGRTMSFTVDQNLLYTVTDGGPGYEQDSVVVDNGVKKYTIPLYDGDLRISEGQ